MRWFLNFKILAKLLMGFILVAVIAGVVGLVGISNINTIVKDDTSLYRDITLPLGEISDINTAFLRIRVICLQHGAVPGSDGAGKLN